MKTTTIRVSVSAVLACSLAFAADAPVRVKISTILPRGSSTFQILQEMGAKWREAGVTPVFYPDGVMGGEAETISRIRVDQIQGAVLSVGGLGDIDRAPAGLQLLPMMFKSLEEVEWVQERLRPILDKRLADRGFITLMWADAAWVQLFSRKGGLRPDDYRNKRLFALAGEKAQADLMKAAGFDPVSLEYTDITTGLQTGQIDIVPTAPFFALAGQFYQPAPYMLEMNYAPVVGALVMNRRAWDSIPEGSRDAVRKAAEEAGRRISARSKVEMRESIEAMQKRGLTVIKLTPAAEAEWRALFASLHPKIRGTMVPADIFDEVVRLVGEYRK